MRKLTIEVTEKMDETLYRACRKTGLDEKELVYTISYIESVGNC